MFLEPAKSMGIFKLRKSGIKCSGIHEDNVNMPWFTKECDIKRAEYFKLKNKLCKLRTEEAKTTLKMEANKYKRFIKTTRKSYFRNLHERIRNLKCSNPKEYWNVINKVDKSPQKSW